MKQYLAIALLALMVSCQSAYHLDAKTLPKNIEQTTNLTLITTNDKVYPLANILERHDATVLIFWQISCPCVRRYQNRIERLYKNYNDKNIGFYYVSSNSNESFADVTHEYDKRAASLPLLRDEGGVLARSLLAKGTPSAAIMNKKGELLFLGWIDNEREEKETGRLAYLENALQEIVQKLPITVKTSPMFGCAIR